ncbi:MAG: zinc-binding dehydrogenase [Cyanobacteria bacterium]|jgi:NADPH:quinone reductase-like Zn-dependent oxidoreductase|nr:zinc-binding dehydrogenase [Cyanobacteria bacterium GSL.Bin21]
MKAAVINQFGNPEVFNYIDVETPEPKPNEVRIQILATGLNRLDHYLRLGKVNPDLSFPHVLGSDAVGIVDAKGTEANRFSIGEPVIPLPGYPLAPQDQHFQPMSAAPSYLIRGVAEWGTYAEYMVVPEQWLVRDDTGLKPEEAATLPMPLVTCVRAVKVVGEAKEGDMVVVHGAASGTGSISIQIAKALGAKVAATIRTPEKEEFVRQLGADLVIKTQSEDFVEEVKKVTNGLGADLIIDNLGGYFMSESLKALKPLGILVSMGMVTGMEATFNLFSFFFAQQQIRGSVMGDRNDLLWGLEQVKAGSIKPTLDQVYALHEAHTAHERLSQGKARGTIVLKPLHI